ncbi:MAG: hypothetical protein QXL15_04680, partial [Candidatus Korarchaeota archaeon]
MRKVALIPFILCFLLLPIPIQILNDCRCSITIQAISTRELSSKEAFFINEDTNTTMRITLYVDTNWGFSQNTTQTFNFSFEFYVAYWGLRDRIYTSTIREILLVNATVILRRNDSTYIDLG